MIRKILLYLFFVTSSLIAQESKSASIRFDLVIGEDDIGKPEYLFDYPGTVETDKYLNIYIAEKKALTIRVFDKNGKFIRNIGRRGRGPGEFLDLTLFTINSNDELLVFDNFMFRITYFSLDGNYKKEIKYSPSIINWPRSILQLKDDNYLLSYYLGNESNLFFLWDKNFVKRVASIGEEYFDERNDIELKESLFYSFFPNYAASKGDYLAVTKNFYNGVVYLFQYLNGSVKFLKRISGYSINKTAYSKSHEKNSDLKHDISISYFNKKFQANIHSKSLGIFFLKNGTLINFTKHEAGKEIIFGYEKYDRQFKFLGYYQIEKTKITNENRRMLLFGIEVAHKDFEDNFYLIDNTEYPKVKKIRLE